MKYNKSEIMKAAWKHYRNMVESINKLRGANITYSFSEALRFEWKEAKKKAAIEELIQSNKEFHDGITVKNGAGFDLELNRWAKYGHDRIYIGNNCGYYDIKADRFFWSRFHMGTNTNTPSIERQIRSFRF